MDTGSTAIQFLFICDEKSTKKDCEYRDVIFEVITANKVLNRFDTSHTYWEKFSAQVEKTRKKLGLFEIEHIDDLCQTTIAVNPMKSIKNTRR